MRLSYKYRLRLTSNQEARIASSLETHRHVYNDALAERKEGYGKEGKTLRLKEQYPIFSAKRNDQVNAEKKGEDGPHWLAHIPSVSMRDTIKRLDKAFDSFFRRVKRGEKPGYPRFRGRDRYDSIPFDNYNKGCALVDPSGRAVLGRMPDDVSLTGYRVKIFGVGSVRIKLHRPIQGNIKTVTIKKEGDKWFAVFSCDLGEVPMPENTNPPVGIDVGLEHFSTDSDGNHEANPRYLKETLPYIKKFSKKIALRDGKKHKRRMYCQRGSKRRNENKRRLRNLHEKVKNQRRDHHHKLALKLVRKHGLIAVENLNILGMLRNRRLSRAIADAGWFQFLQILKYKAESAGAQFIEVDPRGTSQQCSGCGAVVKKELSERTHSCDQCGLVLQRDHNAALNILGRALRHGDGQSQRVRSPASLGGPKISSVNPTNFVQELLAKLQRCPRDPTSAGDSKPPEKGNRSRKGT